MKHLLILCMAALALFACVQQPSLKGTTWVSHENAEHTNSIEVIEFLDSTVEIPDIGYQGKVIGKHILKYKLIKDTIVFSSDEEGFEMSGTTIPLLRGDEIIDSNTNKVLMTKRK